MYRNVKKQNNKINGFSLLELLISMFIFTIIILVSVAVFSKVFSARKSTREIQVSLENARTAMETIDKNIRMSNKLQGGGASISMFNNSQQKCMAYIFSGGSLKSGMNDPTDQPTDLTYPTCGAISATNTMIAGNVSGAFNVIQTQTTDPKRIGRATIRIDVSSGSTVKYLQTTVSFRDYDDILY